VIDLLQDDPSLTPEANRLIRSAIRRSFARTEAVTGLLNANKRKVPRYKKDGDRHKVDQVQHLCNICKDWKPGKVQVDHIIPVVDTKVGFVDWNTYIRRVFCGKENLQVVCHDCHQAKTNLERDIRNTIKYNTEIDYMVATLETKNPADLRRLLAKYTSKTRPAAIKERAKALRARLK
jgi:hypothetical protein